LGWNLSRGDSQQDGSESQWKDRSCASNHDNEPSFQRNESVMLANAAPSWVLSICDGAIYWTEANAASTTGVRRRIKKHRTISHPVEHDHGISVAPSTVAPQTLTHF
jgi:hypothetical protein